jgi:2-desacetyl-2-hydroxyethyl bacteriochlorophyllide A dehydrogenase
MGQVLVFEGPRRIGFIEEEVAAPGAGEVLVRTLYSGISAGTELTAYRGTNPYLTRTWNPAQRLFTQADQEGYPAGGWREGYEEVGEIAALGPGTDDLQLGQRVYGIWGHREMKVLAADYARARILPPHVPPVHGIFARIGEIALNAMLDGEPHLGETVAVFGLGVIGQLVCQLARLSGARVIGVDLVTERLDLARTLEVDVLIDGGQGMVAEQVKQLTEGRGADVCFEVTGNARGLHEAIRACAYTSRVVAVGFYQGEAAGLRLGEEFHHNRVAVICSQISGVNPALQHRWDRPRLTRAFMGLVAEGRVLLDPLITHVVPFREAAAAYELLDKSPSAVMQAVLSFASSSP